MAEKLIRWNEGRVRKTLRVRFYRPLGGFWGWLRWRLRHGPIELPFAVWLGSCGQGSSECYCPEGSQTHLHVEAFGHILGVWIERDWVARPCFCDACVMFLFDDLDEIEANGGREALIARFPGLADAKPLYPAGDR